MIKEILKNDSIIITIFFGYVLCPIFSVNKNSALFNIFFYYPIIMFCWYLVYKIIYGAIEDFLNKKRSLLTENTDKKEFTKDLSDKIYFLIVFAYCFFYIIFSQIN